MSAIRAVAPGDRAAWERLWRGYLDFYGTVLPEEVFDAQWSRLMASDTVRGLVAVRDARLAGLAHLVLHVHGWKTTPVCYLQDLYVDPEARGEGLGRQLLEAVYGAADAAGAPDVYWLTQSGNVTARRLYDRAGRLTDFIKYQRR